MQHRWNENKHGQNWGTWSFKKPWSVRVTSEWSDTEAGREVQVSWVAFKSDGRQDEELDTRIGKACAVMRALYYSVVMKRELSKNAKLSISKAVFVPILTCSHESWIMTERMRSQVQASEMRFLRRIKEVTLFNKVRSSEIRKSLNIEPLLLRIERSQLRWFGHVSRMPQERLPKQALLAKANGRRPVGRPRTRWTDYIEDLGWNRLGLRPNEMMEVMEDREVLRLNLELLPSQPSRKSGQWRKKKNAKQLRSINKSYAEQTNNNNNFNVDIFILSQLNGGQSSTDSGSLQESKPKWNFWIFFSHVGAAGLQRYSTITRTYSPKKYIETLNLFSYPEVPEKKETE